MAVYRVTRKTQFCYGASIGILVLDAAYPCVPGNVGNATTFPFPVRYQVVRGATIDRLLKQADSSLADPFIEASIQLQDHGVKAITGACGFMALFQKDVAAAVDIPVFLSSLIQVPFMHRITNGRPVGIITANSASLTPRHFDNVGIDPAIPLVIAGMENHKEFREAILEEKGTLDSSRIEVEVTEVAAELVRQTPEIGSILLECSDLPPYAHAIQAITGRPVFDFVTMIKYVHLTLVHHPFTGAM